MSLRWHHAQLGTIGRPGHTVGVDRLSASAYNVLMNGRRRSPGVGRWKVRVHAETHKNESPAFNPMHPDETPEQTLERRLRESRRVDERVVPIFSYEDFERETREAGHKLVVLEVESTTQCDSGLTEEAELQWREERVAALDRCKNVKHVFQRVARDSPDVIFLQLEAETEEGAEACERLGVEVIPSLQFWRDGVKLWEHRGVLQIEQDLGEGVLFYGDTAANGVKPSDFVKDLRSKDELRQFIEGQDNKVLTVVNVSVVSAAPCIRIFPAVLALARNFQGFAAFGRFMMDTNEETEQLAKDLKIVEVPTFIFYRGGKEVGRHVGSSRADLIGQILQQQAALGITPPPPRVAPGAVPRRAPAPTS